MAKQVERELEGCRPLAGPDERLTHVVCCVDPSITLCGLGNAEALDESEQTTCVVCDDLQEQARFCPRGGRCENSGCTR